MGLGAAPGALPGVMPGMAPGAVPGGEPGGAPGGAPAGAPGMGPRGGGPPGWPGAAHVGGQVATCSAKAMEGKIANKTVATHRGDLKLFIALTLFQLLHSKTQQMLISCQQLKCCWMRHSSAKPLGWPCRPWSHWLDCSWRCLNCPWHPFDRRAGCPSRHWGLPCCPFDRWGGPPCRRRLHWVDHRSR